MARYRIEDYGESDEKSEVKWSEFYTVIVAIFLYVTFGILLTLGSILWSGP